MNLFWLYRLLVTERQSLKETSPLNDRLMARVLANHDDWSYQSNAMKLQFYKHLSKQNLYIWVIFTWNALYLYCLFSMFNIFSTLWEEKPELEYINTFIASGSKCIWILWFFMFFFCMSMLLHFKLPHIACLLKCKKHFKIVYKIIATWWADERA